MPKSAWLSDELHAYICAHSAEPDPVQRELIEETAKLGGISLMQIAPEQGAFMGLLVGALGAKRVIEVGTFTGYSALAIAKALPDDGELLCCDVSEEWTSVAKPFWEKAGVAGKIELRIAPALETLESLPADESWDAAFIDADKPSYAAYFEALLPRLKKNGLILVDNVLWMGTVANPEVDDDQTKAVRAFNDLVADDPRVETAMVPVGDGITFLRKK